MIIPLPSAEDFSIRDVEIAGEICKLINPKLDFKSWTKENLIYRSCIINSAGQSISLSLPKFFNDNERPEIAALPKDLNNVTLTEKLDGSTIIVSMYKSFLVVRTRGSHVVTHHDTGEEIWRLIKEYNVERAFNDCYKDQASLIFEHVSPNNKIVLNYDKPELYLIGGIYHSNYQLFHQNYLDFVAIYNKWKRPKIFTFSNYEEAIKEIGGWRNQEGVVAYFHNDQSLIKIKSADYLRKHYLKSTLGSVNALLDKYFIWWGNFSECKTFKEYFLEQYDFEIFEYCKQNIEEIYNLTTKSFKIEYGIRYFIKTGNWISQKDFAIDVQNKIKKDHWWIAFTLKSRALNLKEQRKLIDWIIDEENKKSKEKASCENV